MLEIYNGIIQIYMDLALRGINILSILLTIGIVHGIKTFVNKFIFYNKKTGSFLNLVICIIVSISLSIFMYSQTLSIYNVILTGIIGATAAVFSREIIDAIRKIVEKNEK